MWIKALLVTAAPGVYMWIFAGNIIFSWLLYCVEKEAKRLASTAIGPGGTPLYDLYGDVPLDRVWFLASLLFVELNFPFLYYIIVISFCYVVMFLQYCKDL